MTKQHATFPPSSMKMFLACEASLLDLELKNLMPESEHAAEGTLAHEYVEKVLKADNQEERLAIINSIEDMEMQECVIGFCNEIDTLIEKIGPENVIDLFVEERVHFSDNISGTADVLIFYVKDGEKRLCIVDFKYGKGVSVPAQENEQMLTYAVAAMKEHNFPAERATLIIYQPRNFEIPQPLDHWHAPEQRLKQFGAVLKRFERKALRIVNNEVEETPKEFPGEHCRWCHRKPFCASYARFATAPSLVVLDQADPLPIFEATAEVEEKKNGGIKEIKIKPGALTDAQINIILQKADLITLWIKAVQKYAAMRYSMGDAVKGWKLVEGRKTRRWVKDINVVAEQLKELGISDPYVPKLKGLGVIEKELGKGKKELIANIVEYNSPKPKLVPETDPRPALESATDMLDMLDEFEENEE